MQIDTNVSLDELPDNHPITDVLNDREKALYFSAVQNLAEAAEEIQENFETGKGELDVESPKQIENRNQLRNAITLGELIEEVAAGRKQGFSKESSDTFAGER